MPPSTDLALDTDLPDEEGYPYVNAHTNRPGIL